MKYILSLLLLVGCANARDNTTIGDKAVIGSVFAIMALAANSMSK